MNEQLKILEMIQSGQITAEEGSELLDALKESNTKQELIVTEPNNSINSYKYLVIKITSDNNTVNVNVNVPISLLTTLGGITTHISSFIPAEARKHMDNNDVDMSSIDFSKIIKEITNGTLKDPNIVNVETWDEKHQTMIHVRIYVQ